MPNPQYIPDSPALDEGARRYASTHIYTRPLVRGPKVPKPAGAEPGSSSAAAAAAAPSSPLDDAAENGDETIEGLGGASPVLPRSGSAAFSTGRADRSGEGDTSRADAAGEEEGVEEANEDEDDEFDSQGPPSPAESGVGPVANARHTRQKSLTQSQRGGSPSRRRSSGNNGSASKARRGEEEEEEEEEYDPYSMLGDDFGAGGGAGGGYAADRPQPRGAGLADSLL